MRIFKTLRVNEPQNFFIADFCLKNLHKFVFFSFINKNKNFQKLKFFIIWFVSLHYFSNTTFSRDLVSNGRQKHFNLNWIFKINSLNLFFRLKYLK